MAKKRKTWCYQGHPTIWYDNRDIGYFECYTTAGSRNEAERNVKQQFRKQLNLANTVPICIANGNLFTVPEKKEEQKPMSAKEAAKRFREAQIQINFDNIGGNEK